MTGADGVAVDTGLMLVLSPSGADVDGRFAAAVAYGGCEGAFKLVVTCGLPIWS